MSSQGIKEHREMLGHETATSSCRASATQPRRKTAAKR
jgi:hypothetical protein